MNYFVTGLNYILQGLVYWHFFIRSVPRKAEKNHLLIFTVMCFLFYPLDLLLAALPGNSALLLKMLIHMAAMCISLYRYLIPDRKKSVLLVVIVIMASALSEVLAALLWGGLISLEFDTFITSAWHDMALFYLSVDAMEFLVLQLILKLKNRGNKSVMTDQIWLLGTSSVLFQTLAWGNLSYMNTVSGHSAPVPSAVIIILLLLFAGGTVMAVRRMIRENTMVSAKKKQDQTSSQLDEQLVYLTEQKQSLDKVRSVVSSYKKNFSTDLSVDAVHRQTSEFLSEQYSDDIILNTLLKYYDSRYKELNLPHSFEITCSMKDALPADKTILIFSPLLENVSDHAELSVSAGKGLCRISLDTGSDSAKALRHIVPDIQRELEGYCPVIDETSGPQTHVSVIFQKGGSDEAQ